jgi:CHAD domain-containing protein
MTEANDGAAEPTDSVPEAAAFPLLAYLDGLMAELAGRVPAALDAWDADAIHQSRVATRRMKAALDLMKPVLARRARRAFARRMRRLRRRLGPLRDADVMLEHLAELGSEDARFAPGVAWLSERVCRERECLRRRSSKGRPSASVVAKLASWQTVRDDVLAAREAVDSLLAESLHLQLDAFAEQADRLSGSQTDSRQDPHELRISGKALRYTLDMADLQGHDLPASLTKTFKRMQDALGLWHDYVVLADHAMQAMLDEQLAHHEPELTNSMLDLLRELVGRASGHLDEFRGMWSAEGDNVARAVRTSFPLTHAKPVSEPQTGPDPAGSAPPVSPAEGCPPAAASGA